MSTLRTRVAALEQATFPPRPPLLILDIRRPGDTRPELPHHPGDYVIDMRRKDRPHPEDASQ